MIVDLLSDTVTKPTPEMLQYMMQAQVGDDVYGGDPTTKRLEEKIAKMFNKESALYFPSGTMANQVAIKTHTQPGQEIICHKLSHIYYYESGGPAFHSGLSTCLLSGDRGHLDPDDVENHINPSDDVHRPPTALVSVENTMNKGGGSIYDFNKLVEIGKICKKHNLKYHLDGARLFNALVETEQTTEDYGNLFDSISVCMSKGLGAPVGSVLMGDSKFINTARRYRKMFGGGMRQSGYLAAACIYALDNNILRLKDDHRRAKLLSTELEKLNYVQSVAKVETNIVLFKLDPKVDADNYVSQLKNDGILTMHMGYNNIRMVTHLGIDDNMIDRTIDVIKKYKI
ncbi:MAG: GntG family PLP-dependent aldolase [Lentimicrobiaceae bacterium]|nr:GntG family PLP-dependent aldolase [Lentimicrobiaceae bacterium]